MNLHWGIQLQPQYTSWAELRDTGLLVDRLGYDSLMTWDHFVPLIGDATGPNFEGWQLLAAWAALTESVGIGMLVTGNTYRHPAVLANMAATLDHISGGRAILGLGAAWHEREHQMYGIPFDDVPTRLRKLGESVRVVRGLLDEPRTTLKGRYYTVTDAIAEPKPVQRHLPLLIGGGGEQVTLKIAARHADLWHGFGGAETFAHKIDVLKRHCDTVRRDFDEITPTGGGGVIVRDREPEISGRLREVATRNRSTAPSRPLSGTADQVAEHLVALCRAGARGFIFGMPAPFDHETIERLVRDVKPRVEAAAAA